MNCHRADVILSAMAKPPPPDGARRFIPPKPTLNSLRKAAQSCTACALYRNATQTVFGAGPAKARLMLVGEQPGDAEDRAGLPFVGPAGRLLDRALADAGIDRSRVYVTNAVKHFKWVQRGKRRLHRKPGAREIQACYPWLEAEIAALKPAVIVCLGATAAQAPLGRDFRVTQRRGEFVATPFAPHVMATIHPSSLLRAPDPETRERELARFIAELRTVAALLCSGYKAVNS
jgi:DNA polymerase